MGFFDKLKIGGDKKSAQEDKKPKKTSPKAKPSQKTAAPAISGRGSLVERPAPLMAKKDEEELPKKDGEEKSDFEGELAIDVYETNGDFIIKSTIAGVKAEELDITIENDIVTIRGSREKQTSEETKKYYYQECYWGTFSRQVILPEEVDGSKAEASMKDGVLTLKIPKTAKIKKRKIAIKQES